MKTVRDRYKKHLLVIGHNAIIGQVNPRRLLCNQLWYCRRCLLCGQYLWSDTQWSDWSASNTKAISQFRIIVRYRISLCNPRTDTRILTLHLWTTVPELTFQGYQWIFRMEFHDKNQYYKFWFHLQNKASFVFRNTFYPYQLVLTQCRSDAYTDRHACR